MRNTGRRAAVEAPEAHFTLVWFLLGFALGALIGWFLTRDLVGLALGAIAGLSAGTTVNLIRARHRGDLRRGRRRYHSPV